ncbi:MerR family transcriptional regulator [Dichotomicrobium thermohalophilum]|uniref:MerR family transcriptional regulator n=1 Tax=Dichotomicrobium thermohalophilum TaxID=933063 RepID=UPI0011C22D2C|nr:MerR family transcriptional regulator [Dichotomicrobium thermohalophilum]
MKNITLAVDEEVLATVRAYAARNNTTVNALVRQHLERIARQEDKAAQARQRLVELAAQSPMQTGSWRWNRDEIYDRDVLPRHQHPDLRGFSEPERDEEEEDRG